ncbi:hypothetical protein [Halostella litorea]|uniref:hypothetical protein n=1 Tax=Halostella litorea TaxID=2528831 RepID=UPI001F29BF07|nr:hypothetical protein [Halostella litorea]
MTGAREHRCTWCGLPQFGENACICDSPDYEWMKQCSRCGTWKDVDHTHIPDDADDEKPVCTGRCIATDGGTETDDARQELIELVALLDEVERRFTKLGQAQMSVGPVLADVDDLREAAIERGKDNDLIPQSTPTAPLQHEARDLSVAVLQTDATDEAGLHDKYAVFEDGEPVADCFVLEPETDPAAREALIRYAEETDDEELAQDLCDWVTAICTEGNDDE